ncbi:hypothetical protein D3Z51_00155 [Clostridiaceae bacterium]|nr:hypothetical protein [Clostridiaceae bacterium]RKI16540.1 hypothetical protein D7V81_04755 [bacterium 1XD21-70]
MFWVMPVYSLLLCVLLMLFSWNVEDKRQIVAVWIVVVGYLLVRGNSSPLFVCPGVLSGALGLV